MSVATDLSFKVLGLPRESVGTRTLPTAIARQGSFRLEIVTRTLAVSF
jgi:hypothetical protein